jgi:hypothetical protein
VNWYDSLNSLLQKWNVAEILANEPDAEDIAEVAIMFTEIRLWVKKVHDKSVEMDILKMRESSSMPLYTYIRTHSTRDKFLNFEVSWNAIKTFVQLRCNLS